MMMRKNKTKITLFAVIALTAVATLVAARDNTSPQGWLQKMSSAVRTLNYEGTVIRTHDGVVQPLKVVHKKIEGVVNERIVVQEGNGLEIIRVGDEVHCILPDKKSVLIEHWENASALFASLPSSKVEPGAQYDVLILARHLRVAGRNVVKIAIRPSDAYRYEHRFWLDESTGFPLRTELVGHDGNIIAQLKFVDINIDAHINAQMLAPSMSLTEFTWYADPGKRQRQDVETDWKSDELPPGFTVVSTQEEIFPGSEQAVTHIDLSDGMASVSVFISEMREQDIRQSAQRGASNSYSTEHQGYQITAVGEVPPLTVETIATSMYLR